MVERHLQVGLRAACEARRVALPFGSSGMFLLRSAHFVSKAYLFFRRVRLLKDPKNHLPYFMGAVLDATFGSRPEVEKVARFVFLSLSLISIAEDLDRITSLTKRSIRLIKGKEYVPLKRDRFERVKLYTGISPSRVDERHYKRALRKEQMKQLKKTLKEIAKQVGHLTFHLSDAYVAANENTTSLLFIHGNALLTKLTSDRSFLIKSLKRTEETNDAMLKPFSVTTKVMLHILMAPTIIKDELGPGGEVNEAYKDVKVGYKVWRESVKIAWQEVVQGPLPEHMNLKYSPFLGNKEIERFIDPPRIDPAVFFPPPEETGNYSSTM